MGNARTKGRFIGLFVAILFVLQLPLLLTTQAQATATKGEFPYITGVTLTDPTTGEDLSGETDVSKDANVRVNYTWSIPDSADVKASDAYTFTIPPQIKVNDGTTYHLTDSDGNDVAVVAIGSDGNGTLTFTDYVSTHASVNGTLSFTSTFDSTNISNNNPVKIPFTVNGETTNIDINFKQPAAENAKSGSYDAATGIITWTVALNTNSTTIANGHLTDVITPGSTTTNDKSQTYVAGSFKVVADDGTVLYDAASGAGSGTFSYTPATSGDTAKTGTIDYAFGSSFDFNQPVTVTYQTKLVDPSQYFGSSVPNKATFEHDGSSVDLPATVAVPKPDYISKSGTYNSTTKNIDWTITFNKDNLSLHGVKVTDTLPAGLTLVDGSVKLDGTASSSYTYTGGAGGTLTYTAGDITAEHTLTFSTSLPEDYWLYNHGTDEFANSATMTSTDNSYLENGATGNAGGVSPGNSVITKSSLGYDGETHEITWQVVVNASEQSLPDAYFKDVIPAGQAYEPGTFSISLADAPANSLTSAQSFKVSGDSTSGTTLEYKFGAISSTYTITFKTQLTDPTSWAGNSNTTFVNDAWLYPTGSGDSSHAQGQQPVNPNVVAKSGSYDYTTHELTWAISANTTKVPLTNVVLADSLTGNGLDDFDLETGTIQVDGTTIAASSSSSPDVGTYYYDTSTKLLTINLGDLNGSDTSSRTKTITFKMKLNKTGSDYDSYFFKNGVKNITNVANLTSTESPTPATSSATVGINNTVVGKTGSYTGGKAYIDWSVEVNQNGISLQDVTLTDTLAEGLELDTSSIAVYPQTIASDGSLSPTLMHDSDGNISVAGTPATLAKDNVSYDAETRKFVLTLPEGVGDGAPCLIVFRTTIDLAYAGQKSFSNQIDLNGSTTSETSSSGGVSTVFSSSDGTAYGTTANVTVTKVTSTGTPLAGAIFGLYDQYGNLVRISSATDASGNATFGHINYATKYSIAELSAPADYIKSNTVDYFMISKATKQIQLYTVDSQGNWTASGDPIATLPAFANTLKAGTITFTKLGDGGAPLSGAEFTLCDASGNPISGFAAQTSDADGKVTFTGVPYGDYLIKETGAPVGYVPLTISVSLHDSNTMITTDGTTNTLDLGNQQDTAQGSLTLTKRSAEYEGGPTAAMSGITFQVIDSTTSQVVATQTTDADGKAVFADLPLGSYTLHEVSTPTDYQALPDSPFTISADQTAAGRQLTASVTDVKESGTIKLTKVDSASGDALEGAVFTLYDSTGTNVISNASGPITATSNASGVIELDNVPYGDYVLRETTPAHNHEVCPDIPISLRDSNTAIVGGTIGLGNISDNLSTGAVSFTKTDGATPLAGAEFTLTRADGGFSATATSSADGIVTFADVPYSDSPYTLHESKTPDDGVYFAVNDVTFTLNDTNADVTTEGQAHSFALSNQVDVPYGSIALTKTDETGAPLAGAEFQLVDATGEVAQTATTDDTGNISFAKLPLKPTGETTYTLHESKAPGDYALAADRAVTLSNVAGGRDASVAISDALKVGSITLTKVDSVTGSPLAGATFTLYGQDGNPVLGPDGQPLSATTGDDGTLAISGVSYGDYVLKETTAPDGYQTVDSIDISLHDGSANMSDGVLSLGKVADIQIPSITTGNGTPPDTGDTSLDGIGWFILAAAIALGAAGAIRHLYSRK